MSFNLKTSPNNNTQELAGKMKSKKIAGIREIDPCTFEIKLEDETIVQFKALAEYADNNWLEVKDVTKTDIKWI